MKAQNHCYPLAPMRLLLAALNNKPAAAHRRALLAELKYAYPQAYNLYREHNG